MENISQSHLMKEVSQLLNLTNNFKRTIYILLKNNKLLFQTGQKTSKHFLIILLRPILCHGHNF